jgi:hypothetical protein
MRNDAFEMMNDEFGMLNEALRGGLCVMTDTIVCEG